MQSQQQYPSSVFFETSNFASKLIEKLLAFTQNEKLSDICIITSDDMRFNAHKCILSSFSDFFLEMFQNNGLKDATFNEIKIQQVKGKTFRLILNFLYTGRIELKNNTIEDIAGAANFFQIQSLIGECYNFMGENLDTTNCLVRTKFADQHDFNELFEKAVAMASANFENVSSGSDFFKLDENQLRAIVASGNLRVTSEEAVFFKLVKWIDHDKESREKCAVNLFSTLRYWLLSPEFIKQHRSKLPFHAECLEMVCRWLEWHSLPDSRRIAKPMKFLKPKYAHGLLFVGGGAIQTYDLESNTWIREEIPKLPRQFDHVVAFKNKLIISREDHPLTCFDLQTQRITNFLPKQNAPRSSYGLAVLNDELYVIGGYNYSLYKCRRIVDKYNHTIGKWESVTPMNNIFYSPKVAVANGQIYVVGDKFLTMQCLNPITSEWTSKPIPDKPNSAFGFTQVGGNLYKIGGKYWDACFQSLQCYNPDDNLWEEKREMEIELYNPHCIGWNNRLLTCGGFDARGMPLKLVQEYNPLTNEWRTLLEVIDYNPSNENYALVTFDNETTTIK